MRGANWAADVKWRTGVINILQATGADVICLQECGTRPPSAIGPTMVGPFAPVGDSVELYAWGSERGMLTVAFYEWDNAGHRVNLAIVAPEGRTIGTQGVTLRWTMPPAPSHRPVLGMFIQGSGWVFSLHGISGSGVDDQYLLVAAQGGAGANAWWVAGDYNREPTTFPLPGGSAECPPDLNTYSVENPYRKYDFCVRSGPPAVTGTRMSTLVMSDHFPVAYGF